jgi:hypothetical protein
VDAGRRRKSGVVPQGRKSQCGTFAVCGRLKVLLGNVGWGKGNGLRRCRGSAARESDEEQGYSGWVMHADLRAGAAALRRPLEIETLIRER